MPSRKHISKADRRRALELLASCRDGCTEAIMIAHGLGIVYLTYRNPASRQEHQSERKSAPCDSAEVVYLPFADAFNRQEADVERINPFSFYDSGKTFKTIEQISDDSITKQSVFWPLMEARGTIRGLLDGKPIP